MRICFEEVRRAQEVSPEPNFLVLLGDRYGWRPLPEEISAAEFGELEAAARQLADGPSRPPAVDLLRRWYRLDENARTRVWILQPRRKPRAGEPDGRDYTVPETWREAEHVLWRIIKQIGAMKALSCEG